MAARRSGTAARAWHAVPLPRCPLPRAAVRPPRARCAPPATTPCSPRRGSPLEVTFAGCTLQRRRVRACSQRLCAYAARPHSARETRCARPRLLRGRCAPSPCRAPLPSPCRLSSTRRPPLASAAPDHRPLGACRAHLSLLNYTITNTL